MVFVSLLLRFYRPFSIQCYQFRRMAKEVPLYPGESVVSHNIGFSAAREDASWEPYP